MNLDNNKDVEKLSIPELYLAYSKLEIAHWKCTKICDSISRTENYRLPIIALDNYKIGPALWIITGIHGDEPAGPNMIARNIEYIAILLHTIPTLILPLCNPIGYLLNEKYIDKSRTTNDRMSFGDASCKLPNMEYSNNRGNAQNPESQQILDYLITENSKRPPAMVIDLREDAAISKGYVNSQGMNSRGKKGSYNRFAWKILQSMERFVEIQKTKKTRFNEQIIEGIVGPVRDNSIDEFIATNHIYVGKSATAAENITDGIQAETVLRVNIPAKNIELEKRISAQQNVLHMAIDIMNHWR